MSKLSSLSVYTCSGQETVKYYDFVRDKIKWLRVCNRFCTIISCVHVFNAYSVRAGFVQAGHCCLSSPELKPNKDTKQLKAQQNSVQPEPKYSDANSRSLYVKPYLHKTPCWWMPFYAILFFNVKKFFCVIIKNLLFFFFS